MPGVREAEKTDNFSLSVRFHEEHNFFSTSTFDKPWLFLQTSTAPAHAHDSFRRSLSFFAIEQYRPPFYCPNCEQLPVLVRR